MRIAYDMQACQTDSRDRGIGRFADNLVRAMVHASAVRGDADSVIALDAADPVSLRALRHRLRQNAVAAQTAVYTYPTSPFIDFDPLRAGAAAALRGQFCDHLKTDAYVVLSHFETGASFTTGLRQDDRSGTARIAVAYDLIPLVFPENYLRSGEFISTWYPAKCAELKRFDLLLAISQTTRNDLMRLLDIPAERIRVIGAGLDPALARLAQAEAPVDDALLKARGINEPFVLVVSNGDWRKNTLGAVEAFARLPRAVRDEQLLVLTQVGRDVHKALAGRLRHVSPRVRILGKVDDFALATLYRSCRIFFFPSFYEGFGLPVLEAMAFGAPVLSSNQGSLPEVLHDHRCLFDPHDPEAATALLAKALEDADFRESLRSGAAERARSHTWERCADLALAGIRDAAETKRQSHRTHSSSMSGSLCLDGDEIALWSELLANSESEHDLLTLEAALHIVARSGKRRILVDISEVIRLDARTGIQRVVRNFCVGLHAQAQGGEFELCPIYWRQKEGICHARKYAREQLGLMVSGADEAVQVQHNDVLFMLDSSWWMPERFADLHAAVWAHGGEVLWMVYDLVPVLYPHTCNPTVLPAFRHWLDQAIASCDGFICISDATRADLEHFMDESCGAERRPWTRTVHLGCDLESGRNEEPSQQIVELVRGMSSKRMFLSVGTLEPRKDYPTILTAIERRWLRGADDLMVIVGKQGWNVEDLASALRTHGELGKRLLWLETVGDGDLRYLMQHATGFVQASLAEGYGLPVAEAGAFGVPLLLSDIPVFRELAGDAACYFDVGDATVLAQLIGSVTPKNGKIVNARTWQEMSATLSRVLLGVEGTPRQAS